MESESLRKNTRTQDAKDTVAINGVRHYLGMQGLCTPYRGSAFPLESTHCNPAPSDPSPQTPDAVVGG